MVRKAKGNVMRRVPACDVTMCILDKVALIASAVHLKGEVMQAGQAFRRLSRCIKGKCIPNT